MQCVLGLVFAVVHLGGSIFPRRMAGDGPLSFYFVRTRVFDYLDAFILHRIVHRDIKPDNLLIQMAPNTGERAQPRNFAIKLGDFGLSESLSPCTGKTSLKGSVATAPFMSPEMLSRLEYGSKTDVWSAGVMMYVLLYGKFPHETLDTSPQGMKAAIRANLKPISFEVRLSDDRGTVAAATTPTVALLQLMLCRNPMLRCTTGQALQYQWLHRHGPNVTDFNYFPILIAARRCGAFDTRNILSKMQGRPISKLDQVMIEGQSHFSRTAVRRLPSLGLHRARCRQEGRLGGAGLPKTGIPQLQAS